MKTRLISCFIPGLILFIGIGLTVGAPAKDSDKGGKGDNKGKGNDKARGGDRGPQREHQGQPQQAQSPPHQKPNPVQRRQVPQQQQRQQQQQAQRNRQQAMEWQQRRGWARQGGAWQARNNWQQARAQRWSNDHRSWAQRGGYGGWFIPQDRYNTYFGPQRYFRIRQQPVMYMGYPRFDYQGVSFLLVDPYPEFWPENWYETDDVYVDYDPDGYDAGYYMYNRRDPSFRLSISIVL
jgi:hypothetical protein